LKQERKLQVFLFESNIVFAKREELPLGKICYVYENSLCDNGGRWLVTFDRQEARGMKTWKVIDASRGWISLEPGGKYRCSSFCHVALKGKGDFRQHRAASSVPRNGDYNEVLRPTHQD
jgi:hypothetical protein